MFQRRKEHQCFKGEGHLVHMKLEHKEEYMNSYPRLILMSGIKVDLPLILLQVLQ
jgi:hypothetical protein